MFTDYQIHEEKSQQIEIKQMNYWETIVSNVENEQDSGRRAKYRKILAQFEDRTVRQEFACMALFYFRGYGDLSAALATANNQWS